ncbi:hypothetical protein AKO1_014076 [Acrasis kona]|uniref:Na(+)/H(+) antiporter NhaA n=1 Tax=Acrasis kona TaxID=1008807 RepID=A0AAW2YQM6_9EUKA
MRTLSAIVVLCILLAVTGDLARLTKQVTFSKYPKNYVGYEYPGTSQPQIHIELFADILCPYTRKAYLKIKEILSIYKAKGVNIQLRVVHAIQPFHPRSYYVTSTIAAANLVGQRKTGDDTAAFKLTDKFFETLESYSEAKTNDVTPNELLKRLRVVAANETDASEDEIEAAFKSQTVDAIVKGQLRYGRQNGVHVTPSILINGLLEGTFESSWTSEQWAKVIDPLV